jgi:two-component system chemotaxis response regulator CheB
VTARSAHLARPPDRIRPAEDPPIRLLIVDDSSVARAVLSRMVGSQPGLEVVATACCLADALKVLRNVMVDVVLLDIEMPGGSGLEGLPEIIEAGRGAKVLIVSSAADRGAEAAVLALSLGAADTISKPSSGLFGGRFAEALGERLHRIGRVGAIERSVPPRPKAGWRCARSPTGSPPASRSAPRPAASTPSTTFWPAAAADRAADLPDPASAAAVHALFRAAGGGVLGRRARVVEEDEPVTADEIHVAPGNAHLRLVRAGRQGAGAARCLAAPSGCLPSVDPMLASVRRFTARRASR